MYRIFLYLTLIFLTIYSKLSLAQESESFFVNNVTTIYEANIATMESKKVYEGSCCMSSAYIGNLGNNELLITSNTPTSQSSESIFKINLLNKNRKVIAPGSILAIYPKIHKIFYTQPNANHDVSSIYLADFINDRLVNPITLVKTFVDIPITKIDDVHFAFNDVYHDGHVYLYSASENTLTTLPLPLCHPLFYRTQAHQLICDYDEKIFGISLNGKDYDPLNTLNKNVPLTYTAYFPEKDQVIFYRLEFSWVKWHSALRYYLYDFHTKQVQFLNFKP